MLEKLIEINLRAHESLATKGNFDEELKELVRSDISPEVITEYREKYTDLQYIYWKLKEKGLLYEVGIVNHIAIDKLEELSQSKSLKQDISEFLNWKPDYSKLNAGVEADCISEYINGDDISKYSYLQGARIMQIQKLKELLEKRKRETQLYFYDGMVAVENITSPYRKFQHIMKMVENGTCKEEVPPNYKLVKKRYSFTRCREKTNIPSKRWTLVSNGTKGMKDDVYLALVAAFYLGISTFDEIEDFLRVFGISLLSPTEQINSVPMSYIKQAIEAGIHYDNIMYYLRNDQLI